MKPGNSKPYFWFALVVILLFAISAFTFIPFSYRKTVKVPFSMAKTMEQFIIKSQSDKWFNVSGENEKVSFHEINPALVIADWKPGNGSINKFNFLLNPDPTDVSHTVITSIIKANYWQKTLDKSSAYYKTISSLENLKVFMEDTRKFYGYKIIKTLVKDSTFLFTTRLVPTKKIQENTIEMFDTLINYAKAKNIKYNGVRIFHPERIDSNNTQLFASISIHSYLDSSPSALIQFKRMPYNKNLLVAEFTGPYNEIPKVYNALENYATDHSLINMAIPYEQFLTDGYGFSDSQRVRINVYYPFY